MESAAACFAVCLLPGVASISQVLQCADRSASGVLCWLHVSLFTVLGQRHQTGSLCRRVILTEAVLALHCRVMLHIELPIP
jgi:hypothetical protein